MINWLVLDWIKGINSWSINDWFINNWMINSNPVGTNIWVSLVSYTSWLSVLNMYIPHPWTNYVSWPVGSQVRDMLSFPCSRLPSTQKHNKEPNQHGIQVRKVILRAVYLRIKLWVPRGVNQLGGLCIMLLAQSCAAPPESRGETHSIPQVQHFKTKTLIFGLCWIHLGAMQFAGYHTIHNVESPCAPNPSAMQMTPPVKTVDHRCMKDPAATP